MYMYLLYMNSNCFNTKPVHFCNPKIYSLFRAKIEKNKNIMRKKKLTTKDDAVAVWTADDPHGFRRHVQGQGGLKIIIK